MHSKQWFRRRFFLDNQNFPYFSLFLARGQPLDLCKLESPFPKDSSYHLIEINPAVVEKKLFKEKVNRP